ncbi:MULTISPECIES: thioesterase II family protein [Actinomadura]|uniref:Thioesterase II family protein n=1 Tax=Actinomadura yumaensis TaxID=111807 RepID=A0ABW2CBF1_9ACTN|nr:thioesterase domain-containing protein [Actinomadura sp. J1-007]MWK38145.1 putative thioesterase [Actinomadura sp. J1-007]
MSERTGRHAAPAGRTPPGGAWLVGRPPRAGAAVRLYCFPHAGGAPGEFVRWSDDLPGARVRAVQAPGRASRLFERPLTRMADLVDGAVRAIESERAAGGEGERAVERRVAFFGHSLGALVAFEVARALEARGAPGPDVLVVSACPAPPSAESSAHASCAGGTALHLLRDLDLLREVERRWGPLPGEVRSDPELLAFTLHGFRADLEVVETYRYVPGPPLRCAVIAIGGTGDPVAAGMDGWRAHTSGPFARHAVPGGHFHFRERRGEVLRLLHDAITDGEGRPA